MLRRKVTILTDGPTGSKARVEYFIGFFRWQWSLGSMTHTMDKRASKWKDMDGKPSSFADTNAILKALIRHREIALEEFYQITGQKLP
jgi:hypothetical protein